MVNDTYDVGAAFAAIEDELISSMMRNMARHRAEETAEGYEWTMWQAEQLKSLERYKQNQSRYKASFKSINKRLEDLIRKSYEQGSMAEERKILKAIKNGFKAFKAQGQGAQAGFFRLNERKLEALINSVGNDVKKAEYAVLRRANDSYRKAIFNAQVYANTGAGTYEKAVDMATRDMLAAGLNCVQYKNGARHTLSDYASMAIRTANKRAYLQGEGTKRREWGISTVILNKRGSPCPLCAPFVGKVFIDDVWSGGDKSDGKYPLLSSAIAAGLYHPNCLDSHTTYFPGISTPPEGWEEEELKEIETNYNIEQRTRYAERQAERFGRLAKYSLDEDNKRRYQARLEEWKAVADSGETGILEKEYISEVHEVHTVGKIDKSIYSCITDDIATDEVIITKERIQHIKDRHPNDFEKYQAYLKQIVESPDFIVEANKVNTALILKEIKGANNERFKTVLRIKVSGDKPEFKNSVITFMKINEKEWNRLINNKTVLYKRY